MLSVNAFAAPSATEPLARRIIERRELQADDVLVEIHFCGVCHSDVSHARSEWREETYPLVPGHEITGIVRGVGAEVTKYAVGDRVGIGCIVDACGTCANCKQGSEQYCLTGTTLTYGSVDKYGEFTQGGYSTHIVASENFVLRVPDGLELDDAAPLLCAGITTFWPLRHLGVGPGTKVAVVGLGGLGHVAVKLAVAMGAEVTVLSQSLRKRDDGLRLGAQHYFATSDAETFTQQADTFDVILNTITAVIDVDAYLGMLALGGTLVNVGAPAEPLSVNAWSLLRNRRSYTGSLIGSISDTQDMLDFCAEHGVGAEIEKIAVDDVNSAFDRLLASDVRYRFVIDIAGSLA
ncbi:NAD(P)-dependent alcohol dehydrogenase [Rhodococcus sp. NPDC127530]|uniref:NAD(P)-dependent alcohol dehydrogenase n=1 Tax=unclassified Rhodococcus (in: high G+C Gram-positive bacteria) TaxID=192944 RepID=UPI00363AC365